MLHQLEAAISFAVPAGITLFFHRCRLFEDMYSKSDVEDIFAELVAAVKVRTTQFMLWARQPSGVARPWLYLHSTIYS